LLWIFVFPFHLFSSSACFYWQRFPLHFLLARLSSAWFIWTSFPICIFLAGLPSACFYWLDFPPHLDTQSDICEEQYWTETALGTFNMRP
jgi:hypothetical protein